VLHPGDPDDTGNRALIAAGTGLGMALVPRVGGVHAPVASEGGHMDFAPRDDDETALFQTLRRRFGGHVSVERVVSGGGLLNVYEHLRDQGFAPPNPEVERALRDADAETDPSRTISEAGLARRCGICARALSMFVAAYGAAAGNLALVGTATGGVYLGGGIAPKILPALAEGAFLRAFFDKGRFRAYMEAIPVRVILDERTALFGAARLADRLLAAARPPASPSIPA
jgi:glucokinase